METSLSANSTYAVFCQPFKSAQTMQAMWVTPIPTAGLPGLSQNAKKLNQPKNYRAGRKISLSLIRIWSIIHKLSQNSRKVLYIIDIFFWQEEHIELL